MPAHGELRPRLLLLAGSAGESDALEYRFDVGFRVGAWRPVAPKQHLVDEGSGELTDEVAGETVIQRGGGTADEQLEDRRQRPVFQRGLRGHPHRRDYAEARPGCGRSRGTSRSSSASRSNASRDRARPQDDGDDREGPSVACPAPWLCSVEFAAVRFRLARIFNRWAGGCRTSLFPTLGRKRFSIVATSPTSFATSSSARFLTRST